MTLLERGPLLAELQNLLRRTDSEQGGFALVAGEAGIGKTALVHAFCAARAGEVEVLWGSCDGVVPARPFAPLSDIAVADDALREALDAEEASRVFERFLTLLRRRRRSPCVVVFEDLHWADGATLDLLRVVGRRLQDLRVLFIGTYRDDEVGTEHPLRLALGDFPAGVVTELKVPPLSLEAVQILAGGTDVDPVALRRMTAGNPFFLTEVVAAGGIETPATVRDAVFARLGRLSRMAQQAVRAASVLGEECEPRILQEVACCGVEVVDECLSRGMLQVEDGVLRFRHELAERAIHDGLGLAARAALHRRALIALRTAGELDPTRLVRHAIEAGESEIVLELAPAAAERAARLGAHREAAANYAAALRFAQDLDLRTRAELLEAFAEECRHVDDIATARASQEEALACWRRLEDLRGEGNCLRALSLIVWLAGEGDRSIDVAEHAVELLEKVSEAEPELARAYASLAQRHLVNLRDKAVVAWWSQRALDLAARLTDESVAVHALATLGIAEIYLGHEEGWAKVEESWRRAEAAGLDEDATRALINLVEAGRDRRRFDVADRYRDLAIRFLNDRGLHLDLHRRRLDSDLAEIALERGRWEEAAARAEALLGESRTASVIRAKAVTVLGRLRARRGEADPWPLLDEGLELSGRHADGEHLCPLHSARVEAAWLERNPTRARIEAESILALGLERVKDPWWRGELGFWAWRGGVIAKLPEDAAEPYVLHASGRHRAAAASWETIGSPYQQALAFADSEVEEDLREALHLFQSLGARPAAGIVVDRLRRMGARAIPRGPRPATQRNPAGLTGRELEVLALLGQGFRNVDIADRLVVSAKTVDHHVSAILRKLGVPNRAAAAKEAARLGLGDGEMAVPK